MTYTPADRCRSCGDPDLFAVVDLGRQPLANSFRRPDDHTPELRLPLAVVGCPTCSLVQLSGTVDPKVLFDTYAYFSSYSTTMVADMGQLAAHMVGLARLDERSLVVEVASNDGYLLEHYIKLGVRALGIEPARNVADVAVARGVPTWCEYFSPAVAARLVSEMGRADVVHANNVMAHIPDLLGFLEGIRVLLAPGGVAVIETPDMRADDRPSGIRHDLPRARVLLLAFRGRARGQAGRAHRRRRPTDRPARWFIAHVSASD